MKPLLFKGVIFTLIVTLVMSTGCGLLSTEKSSSDGKAGAEKQAIDMLAQFSIVNELATLKTLEIFSEDFTQPLFSEQVSISNEDYNTLYSLMAELGAYEEGITAAISVLVPQELTYRHEVVVAGLLPPSPEILLQAASPGVMSSFLEFFGFLDGTGKRSRERIVKLTQNASEEQQRQIYAELRLAWQQRAKDPNEWFQKLQSGEFDSQASQIHNDFYNNPDLGFYQDAAQDQGEGTAAVVYKEGGEMVEKGSKFYADVATTVVGKALPGFDKGVEKVVDLNDKVEKFEKYTKTFYQGGIGEAVKEAARNKSEQMGTDTFRSSFGDDVGDAIASFTENVVEDKSPDKGQVVVNSPEQQPVYQNVIAFNKDDNAPVKMLAFVGDSGKPASLTLPEGEYLVIATDESGDNSGRNNDVAVTGGQEKVVTMEPVVTTDTVAEVMEKAGDKLQDILQGVEEGKKKLEEITGEKPGEKPAGEAGVVVATPPAEGEYPRDGKWVIKAVTDTDKFTTDDGTTYTCDSFDIQFQIRDGKIQKMHSPKYSYISEDYAAGRGKVSLDEAGALEIVIDKDKIEGRLSDTGGSGTWVSLFTSKGKEYDDCRGTWTAERTGG
jgi:hypothetical protein